MKSFLEKLFVPQSFDGDFCLANGVMEEGGQIRDVKMPDGIRRDQFLNWVEGLEDQVGII